MSMTDAIPLIEAYKTLKTRLRRETGHHSNPRGWLDHDAYKAIVALGIDVVPLIIADLQKHIDTGNHGDYPGWWAMYALPEITGVRIPKGGKEVEQKGGFVAVGVDAVSRWWIEWEKQRSTPG
jgi:hypothetical protein